MLTQVNAKGADTKKVAEAVAELQRIKVSIVDGAGGDVAIPVMGMENEDTIVAVTDLTTPAEVDLANITMGDRRAFGTLLIDEDLEDGDEVEVNGKTYTFVEVEETLTYNPPPNVIPISVGPSGVDIEVVAARLAKVIMSSDSALHAAGDDAGLCTITYRTPGTGGNSTTLVVTGSGGHVTRSGATFSGGSATSLGFSSTDSTAGKKLQVIWYDKNE